mgnify:CR=1 FL=1
MAAMFGRGRWSAVDDPEALPEVLADALGWLGGEGEEYMSQIPEPFTFLPPTQHAVELGAQHLEQDFRAARLVNAEQGVQRGTETPRPEFLAVLLVPGLVDVQHGFARQPLEQLCIRRG